MSAGLRTVICQTPQGGVPCQGLPTPVPGLYVVRDETNGGSSYAVVHDCGIGVGVSFSDAETALAAAVAFGEITDWSASPLAIRQRIDADPGITDAIRRAADRWGGSTIGAGDPSPELLQELSAP